MRLLLLIGLSIAAPAGAQSVVVTESSGRPMVVNGNDSLPTDLNPVGLSDTEIVQAFAGLCTPDPVATPDQAIIDQLKLVSADQSFPANGKHDAIDIRHWSGPGMTLVKFAGSKDALKGERISIVERAYVTSGQYGPFHASMPQCNLVLTLPDFESAAKLATAMETKFGAAKKMVLKKNWADARWVGQGPDGNLAISMTVPKVSDGPQPVHLSAYIKN